MGAGTESSLRVESVERRHWLARVRGGLAVLGGVAGFCTGLGLHWAIRWTEVAGASSVLIATLDVFQRATQLAIVFVAAGIGYAVGGSLLLRQQDAWAETFALSRWIRLLAVVGTATTAMAVEPFVGMVVADLLRAEGLVFALWFPPARQHWKTFLGLCIGLAVFSVGVSFLSAPVDFGVPVDADLLISWRRIGTGQPIVDAFLMFAVFANVVGLLVLPALWLESRFLGPILDGEPSRTVERVASFGWLWSGRLYKGIAALHEGDLVQARAILLDLERSASSARRPSVLVELGWLEVATGDRARAFDYFGDAAADQSNWRAYEGMAVCWLADGRRGEDALRQVEYAIENVPIRPALVWLGVDRLAVPLATKAWALAALGRVHESIETGNWALARTTRHGERASVLWRVASAAALHDKRLGLKLAEEGAQAEGLFGRMNSQLLARLLEEVKP